MDGKRVYIHAGEAARKYSLDNGSREGDEVYRPAIVASLILHLPHRCRPIFRPPTPANATPARVTTATLFVFDSILLILAFVIFAFVTLIIAIPLVLLRVPLILILTVATTMPEQFLDLGFFIPQANAFLDETPPRGQKGTVFRSRDEQPALHLQCHGLEARPCSLPSSEKFAQLFKQGPWETDGCGNNMQSPEIWAWQLEFCGSVKELEDRGEL